MGPSKNTPKLGRGRPNEFRCGDLRILPLCTCVGAPTIRGLGRFLRFGLSEGRDRPMPSHRRLRQVAEGGIRGNVETPLPPKRWSWRLGKWERSSSGPRSVYLCSQIQCTLVSESKDSCPWQVQGALRRHGRRVLRPLLSVLPFACFARHLASQEAASKASYHTTQPALQPWDGVQGFSRWALTRVGIRARGGRSRKPEAATRVSKGRSGRVVVTRLWQGTLGMRRPLATEVSRRHACVAIWLRRGVGSGRGWQGTASELVPLPPTKGDELAGLRLAAYTAASGLSINFDEQYNTIHAGLSKLLCGHTEGWMWPLACTNPVSTRFPRMPGQPSMDPRRRREGKGGARKQWRAVPSIPLLLLDAVTSLLRGV